MIDNRKVLRDCIKKNKWILAAALLISGVNLAVFALYSLNIEPFAYALILDAVFIAALFAGLFMFEKRRTERIRQIRNRSFEEWGAFPEALDLAEKDYQEMITYLRDRSAEIISDYEKRSADADDYYTNWVHQVKTPIAVMKLILGSEDTDVNRELRLELFRIEQYVDMALLYIRLGSSTNDLVIKEYDLDEMVKETIRKFAGAFIHRKLSVTVNETGRRIITDRKWFICILEQLVSNAVKYTKTGGVTIGLSGDSLSVSDTGIGIAKEDLARIFEKGYTGINGRSEKKSSGLGLYLCKRAAEKINVSVCVDEEAKTGAIFLINLENITIK